MIEVRRRNNKGNVQFYGWFDRNSFFNTFNISEFANCDTDGIYLKKWVDYSTSEHPHLSGFEITVREFSYVAYSTNGKILTTDLLLGMYRQYEEERQKQRCKQHPNLYWCRNRSRSVGAKRNHHRGTYYRQIHTTPERRWAHAWDGEEFAPKVRPCRHASNLPNSWEDYRRSDFRNNNWKRYRKRQWKEKKEGI